MTETEQTLDQAAEIIRLGTVGNGSAPRRTRQVLFEFAAAAVQAYVPQNRCHVVGVVCGTVDILVALSASAFPASQPNGGTTRVIDYLVFPSVGAANTFHPMNNPVPEDGTIYVKKYSAGGGMAVITLAFDLPEPPIQGQIPA